MKVSPLTQRERKKTSTPSIKTPRLPLFIHRKKMIHHAHPLHVGQHKYRRNCKESRHTNGYHRGGEGYEDARGSIPVRWEGERGGRQGDVQRWICASGDVAYKISPISISNYGRECWNTYPGEEASIQPGHPAEARWQR